MFKFLRKKIKDTVSKITKKIDEEGEEKVEGVVEEVKEEPKKEEEKPKERKGFFKKIFGKKEEKIEEEPSKEEKIEVEEKPVEEPKEEIIEKESIEEKEEEPSEVIKEEPKVEEKKEIIEEKKLLKKRPIEKEPTKEIKKSEKKIIEEKTTREEKPVEKEKIIEQEPIEIKKEEKIIKEKPQESVEEEKKSFFSKIKQKIVTKKISEKQFESLFWDMELALLENNVAVEVIEKIKEDLKNNIVEKPLRRGKIEEIVINTLKGSIEDLFKVDKVNLIEKIKKKKPFIICFVGINGSGKTTTIAKIARLLMDNKFSVVLAAADTFRAASIEQIQLHGDKLGVKVIKHDYGSDPAAVAYDAVAHAKSKNVDVVLIDTAGRMHSNINLEDEMKKIVRVAKPDLKIFVGESITGNDCVEQAKKFNEAIDIDGIVLSKADIDEKGGAAVSISYVTKKPIVYIGTGQEYSDLKEFDHGIVVESLGLT